MSSFPSSEAEPGEFKRRIITQFGIDALRAIDIRVATSRQGEETVRQTIERLEPDPEKRTKLSLGVKAIAFLDERGLPRQYVDQVLVWNTPNPDRFDFEVKFARNKRLPPEILRFRDGTAININVEANRVGIRGRKKVRKQKKW